MTSVLDIARALGLQSDSDLQIRGVSAASSPEPHTLTFIKSWREDSQDLVRSHPATLFLVPDDAEVHGDNVLAVPKPRLAYALILRDVLHDAVEAVIESTASVSPQATIGESVSIGHFVVVEDGVVIGPGSRIDHHAVLRAGVTVGERVRIGSHTSIGGPGFGFEVDESGAPIRIGHRGGVVIGDDVEIGNHCSIAQGTIEPTRIRDNVKIDDCVFIAHNVDIGEATYIIAGAAVCGSVSIGERVWVSPAATIIQKVTIEDDALVGIGAAVIRDVEANAVVAGVPAKRLGDRYPDVGEHEEPQRPGVASS